MEKKVKKNQDDEAVVEPKTGQPEVTLVRSQSSVQIETDSKGTKKYSIKVYADDPEEAANTALRLSEKIEKELNK